MHRVLVVDDDTATLNVVRELLEEDGYEVTTSADPFVALAELRRRDFDVLLSDIRMPGMDGLCLIGECRKLKPALGVILMTAYPEMPTAVEAIRRGVSDYIIKPVDGRSLSIALTSVLQKARRSGESEGVSVRPQHSLRSRYVVRRESWQLPFVKVYALGQAKVSVGDRLVTRMDWRSEKAKELFFFLLTNPLKYTREQTLEALWPDLHPDKTRSMFHSTAHRLRQAVHPDSLLYTEKAYWLNRNMLYWYDVEEFRHLLARAQCIQPGPERTENLEEAVGLYRGPFLKDFYSDWCTDLGRELEREYANAVLLLAESYEMQSERGKTVPLLQKLLAMDPYNEDAICQLMNAYVERGQPMLAKQCYREYEQSVAEDLRAQPSRRLAAFYDKIPT